MAPMRRYCECFASGRYCDGCNCVNCCNNRGHEAVRQAAVEAILERNPNAFRPKIQANVSILDKFWLEFRGSPFLDENMSSVHSSALFDNRKAEPTAAVIACAIHDMSPCLTPQGKLI
jgi:hypothetical protein